MDDFGESLPLLSKSASSNGDLVDDTESQTSSASHNVNPHVFDKQKFVRQKPRLALKGFKEGFKDSSSRRVEDEEEDYVYMRPNEAPRVVIVSENREDVVVDVERIEDGTGETRILIRKSRRNGIPTPVTWSFMFFPSVVWLGCFCLFCTLLIIGCISFYFLLMQPVTFDVSDMKNLKFDSRQLLFDVLITNNNPNVESISIKEVSLELYLVPDDGPDARTVFLGRTNGHLDFKVDSHQDSQMSLPIAYSFRRKQNIHHLVDVLVGPYEYTMNVQGKIGYRQFGLARHHVFEKSGIPVDVESHDSWSLEDEN